MASERKKAPWSQNVVARIPDPPNAHFARARGEMTLRYGISGLISVRPSRIADSYATVTAAWSCSPTAGRVIVIVIRQ